MAWQHVEDGDLGSIMTEGGAFKIEWFERYRPDNIAAEFHVCPSSARSKATQADRDRSLDMARRFARDGHPAA